METHLYFRQQRITLISRKGSIEAHPGKMGMGMELGLGGRAYGTMPRPGAQNDSQLTLNWGIVATMQQ